MPPLSVPLAELVPHRPPMLWLDHLVEYSPDQGRTIGVVAAKHLFAEASGMLHPSASIELVAQTAAAHEGYQRRLEDKGVGGGFLVGVRDFVFWGAPECGDTIEVVARRRWSVGPVSVVSGQVTGSCGLLAEGELSFYLDDRAVPEAMQPRPQQIGDGTRQRSVGVSCGDIMGGIIIGENRDAGRAELFFERTCPVFCGHFPSFPLLPAVVSVRICMELLARWESDLEVPRVLHAKFGEAIQPPVTITVGSAPQIVEAQQRRRFWLQVDDNKAADIAFEVRQRSTARPGEGDQR